jgi:hypothetical protein
MKDWLIIILVLSPVIYVVCSRIMTEHKIHLRLLKKREAILEEQMIYWKRKNQNLRERIKE